jgi:3-oxoacyl-[acyl-carrier-protein] synthase-3
VDDETCTSDLCYKAAKQLMEDNNIAPESIDMLIFTTLTPDYIDPPTAPLLQERLGLPKTTATMDLMFACTGFIYSLATAYSFVSMGMNRILILVGETMSKLASKQDRVNRPLYGDAGSACLVEKGDFGDSFFELTSDGSGEDFVKVPYGGFRHMPTADSLIMKEREDGNLRRDLDINMDGLETFYHGTSAIPKQIKSIMKELSITNDDVDYFVLHQPNKMMVDFITRKLKITPDKAPSCLPKYGNTSCTSIPMGLVTELNGKMGGKKRLVFSAIGAGWSFGSAYLTTNDLKITPIIEY